MRSFPDELGDDERWIYDRLDPLRRAYFVKGQAFGPNKPLQKDFQFYLPSTEYTERANVAILGISHPKTGTRWKEVVVFRHVDAVHIYGLIDQGQRLE